MTKEAAKVVKTIHELMAKHGLTAADIDGHTSGRQRAKKAGTNAASKGSATAVKYRDPKTGAIWSGRGRAPSWIAVAKNRDKFLVDGSTATAKQFLSAKRRLLAITSAVHSLRFIVTQNPVQVGAVAGALRRELLKPKTEANI